MFTHKLTPVSLVDNPEKLSSLFDFYCTSDYEIGFQLKDSSIPAESRCRFKLDALKMLINDFKVKKAASSSTNTYIKNIDIPSSLSTAYINLPQVVLFEVTNGTESLVATPAQVGKTYRVKDALNQKVLYTNVEENSYSATTNSSDLVLEEVTKKGLVLQSINLKDFIQEVNSSNEDTKLFTTFTEQAPIKYFRLKSLKTGFVSKVQKVAIADSPVVLTKNMIEVPEIWILDDNTVNEKFIPFTVKTFNSPFDYTVTVSIVTAAGEAVSLSDSNNGVVTGIKKDTITSLPLTTGNLPTDDFVLTMSVSLVFKDEDGGYLFTSNAVTFPVYVIVRDLSNAARIGKKVVSPTGTGATFIFNV